MFFFYLREKINLDLKKKREEVYEEKKELYEEVEEGTEEK